MAHPEEKRIEFHCDADGCTAWRLWIDGAYAGGTGKFWLTVGDRCYCPVHREAIEQSGRVGRKMTDNIYLSPPDPQLPADVPDPHPDNPVSAPLPATVLHPRWIGFVLGVIVGVAVAFLLWRFR